MPPNQIHPRWASLALAPSTAWQSTGDAVLEAGPEPGEQQASKCSCAHNTVCCPQPPQGGAHPAGAAGRAHAQRRLCAAHGADGHGRRHASCHTLPAALPGLVGCCAGAAAWRALLPRLRPVVVHRTCPKAAMALCRTYLTEDDLAFFCAARLSLGPGAGSPSGFSMLFYAVPVAPGHSRIFAGYSAGSLPPMLHQALRSGERPHCANCLRGAESAGQPWSCTGGRCLHSGPGLQQGKPCLAQL